MIRRRTIRSIHRFLALWSGVSLIYLCITGLLLNHTDTLNLDSRYVQNQWLLHAYGIKVDEQAASTMQGFAGLHGGESHWFSQWSGQLYFNGAPIGSCQQLLGVADTEVEWVVVCTDQVYLLSVSGEMLEPPMAVSFDSQSSLGMADSGVMILDEPSDQWQWNNQTLQWQVAQPKYSQSEINLFTATPLPADIADEILRQSYSRLITWERVVQDLHSGRLLGQWGVWLVDISAVILLIMAISGLLLWTRSGRTN